MTLRDDLNYGLAAFGVQIPERLPIDSIARRLADDPVHASAIVVAAGGVLFLHFERDANPHCRDITDAMLYTSSCLTVGHAPIQPVTRAGKLLGTLLMTYGPALANRTLEGHGHRYEVQDQVLATLRDILAKLETMSRSDGRPD